MVAVRVALQRVVPRRKPLAVWACLLAVLVASEIVVGVVSDEGAVQSHRILTLEMVHRRLLLTSTGVGAVHGCLLSYKVLANAPSFQHKVVGTGRHLSNHTLRKSDLGVRKYLPTRTHFKVLWSLLASRCFWQLAIFGRSDVGKVRLVSMIAHLGRAPEDSKVVPTSSRFHLLPIFTAYEIFVSLLIDHESWISSKNGRIVSLFFRRFFPIGHVPSYFDSS